MKDDPRDSIDERNPEQSGSRSGAHPFLGLVAYTLVRGERRRSAGGHFQRAGLEALRGFRSLMGESGQGDESGGSESRKRRRIEIE